MIPTLDELTAALLDWLPRNLDSAIRGAVVLQVNGAGFTLRKRVADRGFSAVTSATAGTSP